MEFRTESVDLNRIINLVKGNKEMPLSIKKTTKEKNERERERKLKRLKVNDKEKKTNGKYSK